jgi:hypothetical protein
MIVPEDDGEEAVISLVVEPSFVHMFLVDTVKLHSIAKLELALAVLWVV